MKNQQSSIDGFIPRRPGSKLGELHAMKRPEDAVSPIDRSLHTGQNVSNELIGVPRPAKQLGREDLTESLREIDQDAPVKESRKEARRRRKEERRQHPRYKVWRIIKWALISLAIIAVIVGGYLGIRAIMASNNVFNGNFLDVLTKEPLKEDENGRSNFLIFGTAEDDEGGTHDGGNLTDSIMVMSVDQDKKDAYMISLPRDLWVVYQEQCWVGDQGKINAAYTCASNDGEDEKAGAEALRATAGEILGLDIQYYIHLNFTAVVEAVDAVGGVDVTIQSSDPRGILDRNFDWKCNYTCYYVNYENGEKAHLDGEHALALARARNAAGGYGLPNGNFDREKNQQMIITALRDKALSAGTLANIGAVTGLIDALGSNLRTNIETKEIRTLMDLASNIPNESIISLSLNDDEAMLVTTGSHLGQSIVRPTAGLLDYSEIQEYVKKNISSDPFVKEEPHVTVLNGTDTTGIASVEATSLTDLGFIVDSFDNAPDGTTYEAVEIYQLNPDKKASAAKLETLYSTKVKQGTPPVSVVGESDFLIIIGHESAAL